MLSEISRFKSCQVESYVSWTILLYLATPLAGKNLHFLTRDGVYEEKMPFPNSRLQPVDCNGRALNDDSHAVPHCEAFLLWQCAWFPFVWWLLGIASRLPACSPTEPQSQLFFKTQAYLIILLPQPLGQPKLQAFNTWLGILYPAQWCL